jgi:hypothetical protein
VEDYPAIPNNFCRAETSVLGHFGRFWRSAACQVWGVIPEMLACRDKLAAQLTGLLYALELVYDASRRREQER